MKRVLAFVLAILTLLPLAAFAEWDCVCGSMGNTGNYCGQCGRSEADGTKAKAAQPSQGATGPAAGRARDVYIGEHVYFGSYPQSSAAEQEPIEWVVVDEAEGCALLVSVYCLDAVAFNGSLGSVTWATSGLRRWLNGTFLNSAFSYSEREYILTRTQGSDTNKKHGRSWSESTSDPVFILSATEAAAYLPGREQRKGIITNYARLHGAAEQGWWWLRTAAGQWGRAANIDSKGSFDYDGSDIRYTKYSVRPAVWVRTSGLE